MDLNPVFTTSTSFRPGGAGGELKLFEQAGIRLVHGWLLAPDSPEAKALETIQDYDASVSLIAEVDHLTHGKFVFDEDAAVTTAPSPTSPTTNWSEEEQRKVENGELSGPSNQQIRIDTPQPSSSVNFLNRRSLN